ncbi:MAG: hypothetical protein ACI8RH_001170 [Flavobacteriales bacterium]|jgi:hypothetical protein
MESQALLPYFASLLSAIIVGIVAYLFFKTHTDNEEGRRRFLIHKDAQGKTLPLRLQAYERIVLLLERIDPNSLLIRIKPTNNDLNKYEEDLIRSIEDEFVHNLTQQIYLSAESWNVTKNIKNTTIQIIRQTAMNEKVETADKLREAVLNHFMGEITPSQKGLLYIKKEIHELF